MNGHRKPRRPRWTPAVDAVSIAISRASKLDRHQVNGIMEPIHDAHKALREGVATLAQWQILASAVEMSLGIEASGVVTGMKDHFLAAEQTLAAIKARALQTGKWKPTALYYFELDHVDTAIWLHSEQLNHVSEGELRDIARKAIAQILSAGGTVISKQSTGATA